MSSPVRTSHSARADAIGVLARRALERQLAARSPPRSRRRPSASAAAWIRATTSSRRVAQRAAQLQRARAPDAHARVVAAGRAAPCRRRSTRAPTRRAAWPASVATLRSRSDVPDLRDAAGRARRDARRRRCRRAPTASRRPSGLQATAVTTSWPVRSRASARPSRASKTRAMPSLPPTATRRLAGPRRRPRRACASSNVARPLARRQLVDERALRARVETTYSALSGEIVDGVDRRAEVVARAHPRAHERRAQRVLGLRARLRLHALAREQDRQLGIARVAALGLRAELARERGVALVDRRSSAARARRSSAATETASAAQHAGEQLALTARRGLAARDEELALQVRRRRVLARRGGQPALGARQLGAAQRGSGSRSWRSQSCASWPQRVCPCTCVEVGLHLLDERRDRRRRARRAARSEIQLIFAAAGGTSDASTSRASTGRMRLLRAAAWSSSRRQTSEATQSGEMTQTKLSAAVDPGGDLVEPVDRRRDVVEVDPDTTCRAPRARRRSVARARRPCASTTRRRRTAPSAAHHRRPRRSAAHGGRRVILECRPAITSLDRGSSMLHSQLPWWIGGPVLGLCVVAMRWLMNERLGRHGRVVGRRRHGRRSGGCPSARSAGCSSA